MPDDRDHDHPPGSPEVQGAGPDPEDDFVPVDEARVYVPPVTLPPTVAHKTFEMQTIKIDPSLDPRKAVTQPRMRPVVDKKTPPGPTVVINEQLADGGGPASPRTVGGRTAKLMDAPPAAAQPQPGPVPPAVAARIQADPRTLGGRTERLGQVPSSRPPGAIGNSPWAAAPANKIPGGISAATLGAAAAVALLIVGTAGYFALRTADPTSDTAPAASSLAAPPTATAVATPPAPPQSSTATPTATVKAALTATAKPSARPTGKPGGPKSTSTAKPALPGGATPEF